MKAPHFLQRELTAKLQAQLRSSQTPAQVLPGPSHLSDHRPLRPDKQQEVKGVFVPQLQKGNPSQVTWGDFYTMPTE